jgi:hypothetical protein
MIVNIFDYYTSMILLKSNYFKTNKQISIMKTQVNFNFKSGDGIKFQFELTEENVNGVASSMVRNFEKKIFLLQSKAAAYFKKSNVLSHRKFSMDIFIEDKYVKTVFSGIETSNGLLKDSAALEELLQIMLFEAMDEVKTPEIVEILA